MHRSTALVISHDPPGCEPILNLLRNRRCLPTLLSDSAQAVSAIAGAPAPDFILLSGPFQFCGPLLMFLTEFRGKLMVPPLVVLAVDGSETFALAALRARADDYFAHPIDLDAFQKSISRCLPSLPDSALSDGLTGGEVLVGNSSQMQSLRTSIRRIAATDCNVLITGETGTGKELVAQLIHQNSPRSRHPLICINCAAIPDSLIESELFGYERGAFTGAHSTNPGKLMTANKGTVFFDEIGDMSPFAQAKILRAIEAKEVQRLGATRRYQTDIRILAATHHNLDDLATSASFRRDLYFRLNVGRIHLPPLRERKADIASLVGQMMADLNRKLGRHIEGVSDEAVHRLAQYDWPGNVRELKNVIERIFISRESGKIVPDDLPYPVQPPRPLPSQATDEKELSCLRNALATCNGNKSRAAEQLRCSRMTLYRKLAKYRLLDGSGEGVSTADYGTRTSQMPKKLA
jgi:DNA-binding NtrC family response regulator